MTLGHPALLQAFMSLQAGEGLNKTETTKETKKVSSRLTKVHLPGAIVEKNQVDCELEDDPEDKHVVLDAPVMHGMAACVWCAAQTRRR